MGLLRLFIAIDLPLEIEEKLKLLLENISSLFTGIKWVSAKQLHITLVFLGEQKESLLKNFTGIIEEIAVEKNCFEIELGKIEAFPNLQNPKVLFIPVVLGKEQIGSLVRILAERFVQMGIKLENREYHAHLTLGRVKKGNAVNEAVESLKNSLPEKLGTIKVNRIILYQSLFEKTEVHYKKLESFELAK